MYDDEPNQMHQVACRLVSQGISVIPTGGGLSPRAKQPHYEALRASGHSYINKEGKSCGAWKAMQHRLPTPEELTEWFLVQRARGLGLVTGEISGYVVIDVDKEGLPLMHELGWQPHVYSPGGGAHLYLTHPGWFVPCAASKSQKTLLPGIDVRGDGGYIMFPPSRNRMGQYHRTGQRRRLSLEDVPLEVSVGGQVYHLREALGLTEPVPLEFEPSPFHPFDGQDDERCPISLLLERAADYAPESRNKGAFMLGLWCNANGYREDEALGYVQDYVYAVQHVKNSLFTADEARTAVQSAYRYLPLSAKRAVETAGRVL